MNRQSRRYSSRSPSESRSRSVSKSRSVSRSRSDSRSRSRARTRTRSTRSRSRTRSSSPLSRRSTSSYTSKKYDTVTKKTSNTNSKNSPPQRISKASSESNVNRRQATIGQRRIGVKQQPLRQQQQQRPYTEQVSQTALRVMSAQRLKNNDLNNRLKELTKEMDKLKEENKLLLRVHKREERALKNLETQEHDVSRMIRNHLDESNSLKETIKNIKNENKRLTTTLIDKDEEIRTMKKKNDDMKKILNDKKLFDSVELTKKLENTEKELADFKSKYETLEKKVEVIEKNHKHELGIEIAHHREVQKQLNKIQEENKELKQIIEQKEKALDIANIYSNRFIKDNVSMTPNSKPSTQLLNQLVADSPRSRERSRKKDGVNSKPPKPSIKEDDIVDSERSSQTEMEAKLEREKEEAMRRQKEFENEMKLRREQEEKEKEREKREKEAKRLEAEKLKREKAMLEEEMKKKSVEEEEKKRLEKLRLEEEDRKKRWISENTVNKLNDDNKREDLVKKDELLAKLSLVETKKNQQEIFQLTAVNDKLDLVPTKLSDTKQEPKDELLSKLFGNNAVIKKEDVFNKQKETKISQMPWEAQELSFSSPQKKPSSTTPSSTQIQVQNIKKTEEDHFDFFSKLNSNVTQKPPNGLNRPKLDNKLLFPNIHKSNNFEDVEEIVL